MDSKKILNSEISMDHFIMRFDKLNLKNTSFNGLLTLTIIEWAKK